MKKIQAQKKHVIELVSPRGYGLRVQSNSKLEALVIFGGVLLVTAFTVHAVGPAAKPLLALV